MANNNLRTLLYRLCLITIGNRHFAECLRHSAKPEIHSQRHCRVPHSAKGTRQKINRQRNICRVLFVGHSTKPLPSAGKALGKMKMRKNPKIIANFFFGGGHHRPAGFKLTTSPSCVCCSTTVPLHYTVTCV